jgi:hypothetical protein
VEPQSIKEKPLTASKKQVSFMAPIEGLDEARLNHCREFKREHDGTDFIEALELKDRITTTFWGSIDKYNKWKALKEGRSKSASKIAYLP